MDELFHYLESLHPLTPELRAALVTRTQKETFRKNRPLLSTGQVCNWLAFIEKGFVKLCYDIPGGHERIICFLKTGEMASSITSYHSLIPSRLAIVALEDTTIRKISRLEAETVAEKHPSFHTHLRRITEQQSMQLESHYMLIAEPARDRLAKLPEHCGWMLKDRRIKQYMIADYLGVDRATMSRWNSSNGVSAGLTNL
jgi:CRP-like cAMP-binding protein